MPDKKLTESEIVKALEICAGITPSAGCSDCPQQYLGLSVVGCQIELLKNVLDLLNRQEEKIKLLEKYQTEFLKERLKTEELEERLGEVKEDYTRACAERDVNIITNKFIKAEAYKECIKKVKEKANKSEWVSSGVHLRTEYTIGENTLDNLLKELVGEDNA